MSTKKDFRHLPEQSDQNLQPPQRKPPQKQPSNCNCKCIVLVFVMLLMVAITGYNLMAPKVKLNDVEKYEKQVEQEIKEKVEEQKQEMKRIEELYTRPSGHSDLECHISPSPKAKQRISYGQPRPKSSQMRAMVLQKRSAPSTPHPICILTNGINIISSKTTKTAQVFLSNPQVYKWIVFLGIIDEIGEGVIRALQSSFGDIEITKMGNVEVDSEYGFLMKNTGGCAMMVYLQNTFVVGVGQVSGLVREADKLREKYPEGFMAFTQSASDDNGQRKLQDLTKIDLSTLPEQKQNQHLFIFDTKLLPLITPLNYSPYNKYTLEQILINPLLALTQKSHLFAIEGQYHSFDEVVVQFKEFGVKQGEGNSVCFVASPGNGNVQTGVKSYAKSIGEMELKGKNAVVVVNVAYSFGQDDDLFEVYKMFSDLLVKNSNLKIRLRIYHKKAVPSLAAYESAHSYCQKSSVMVISKFETPIHQKIGFELQRSVSEKYHLYYPLTQKTKTAAQVKQLLKGKSKEQGRFNTEQYLKYFSSIQIVKVQFFKMINVWTLKASDQEFFASEASFMIPLLQMADQTILGLENVLKETTTPAISQIQQKQLTHLQKSSKWPPLPPNSKPQPIPYNSLTNPDLRPGNLPQIPKIIHQVYFKQDPLPSSIQKYQESILRVNQGYQYRLWTQENLTTWDFPMSYALVAGTLEYEWAYEKSYHAWVQALISYEVLYNHGGIYLSLNTECKKPLDSFLKYQLFFSGYTSSPPTPTAPVSFSRGIMGSKRYAYHLRFVLTELITQQTINYDCGNLEEVVGGGVLRASMRDDEVWTNVWFGFQLLGYDGHRNYGSGSEYDEAYAVLHDS